MIEREPQCHRSTNREKVMRAPAQKEHDWQSNCEHLLSLKHEKQCGSWEPWGPGGDTAQLKCVERPSGPQSNQADPEEMEGECQGVEFASDGGHRGTRDRGVDLLAVSPSQSLDQGVIVMGRVIVTNLR